MERLPLQRFLLPIIIVILVIFFSIVLLSIFGKADEMSTKDQSTWLWSTSMIVNNEARTLEFLENKKINKVYLQIDCNISSSVYQDFIEKSLIKGIKVYALDGSPIWVSSEGYQKQDQLMAWLGSYQQKSATHQQFAGIHLDVEPYLNSGWETNREQTIKLYQDLLIRAKEHATHLGLPLEVDMPFWFDGISYSNQYGDGILAEWVIDQVESVTIMAYRDTAAKIVEKVESEIAYAEKVNRSIVVGVETDASNEGQKITFYEEGEEYMNEQLALVQNSLRDRTAFNGIAIHHVDSWMSMLP